MIKKFLQYHPVHKKIVPKFDTIFLLRPTIFFAVWVMVIVGIISAEMNMYVSSLWITKISWEILFVFLGLTLLISAAFVFNQIADDKKEHEYQRFLLIGTHISAEKGKSIARILLISGCIISVITNWTTAIPAICIYFLWGIGYNHELYKWGKVYITRWLVHSLAGILLFIIGWILGIGNHPQEGILSISLDAFSYMLPYILCFSAVSLLTTLMDFQGDDNGDIRTFPIDIRYTTFLFISLLMVSIALYFSLKHSDPLASTAILVSLPFFLFAAIRGLNKDILRAIRYPIFILNFFALSFYPWLIVPLFCTYYLSKYYYWHRFDLHYPTFLVDND